MVDPGRAAVRPGPAAAHILLMAMVVGAVGALAVACGRPVPGRGQAVPPGVTRTVRVPASATNPLGYVAYLPADYPRAGQSYPVIVFLHGLGERGDGGAGDLNIVSSAALPRLAATNRLPLAARRFVILAPQIQRPRWDPVTLHNWLGRVLGSYWVDRDRLYLTGISMGGRGVFDYLDHYGDANEFAAMAPIAGGFDSLPVPDGLPSCDRMSGTPLWAFHGARDDIMPVQGSIQVVAYVNRRCHPPEPLRLTVYADMFHDSWDATYTLGGRTEAVLAEWDPFEPDLYSWFLRHALDGRRR